MADQPIEFVLVRDRETKAIKYIPRTKYEAQRELWAQVAGGKTVTAFDAPIYEPTANRGGSNAGQTAATTKEQ